MVTVYVWNPGVYPSKSFPFLRTDVGHAGCTLSLDSYIGHYPQKGRGLSRETARHMMSYEQDKKQMERSADKIVEIPVPDYVTDTVTYQWAHDSLQGVPYDLTGNNCAHMVSAALHLCAYLYVFDTLGESAARETWKRIAELKAALWNIPAANTVGDLGKNLPTKNFWWPEDCYL